MKTKISKTMEDVLNVITKYGKLIRVCYNDFYTYEGCITVGEYYSMPNSNYSNIPKWNCSVNTLRALERRNLVILDEKTGICSLKN